MSYTQKIIIHFSIIFFAFLYFSQPAMTADHRLEIPTSPTKQTIPALCNAYVPATLFAPNNLNDTEDGLLDGQINKLLMEMEMEIAETGNIEPMISILDHESARNFVSYAKLWKRIYYPPDKYEPWNY